jgi:hypothetical protein
MSESEKISCMGCQGTGKCLKCGGKGNVVQNMPTPIAVVGGEVRGREKSSRLCNSCYGSGICKLCKGSGRAS